MAHLVSRALRLSLSPLPGGSLSAARSLCSGGMGGSYGSILVERRGAKGCVGFVQLNRPKALNSLCDELMRELNSALAAFDSEPGVKSIVVTGGTQRLPRAVGKSKAMEMCLTGDMISAKEAETAGLVSRVLPTDKLVDAAVELGERIGKMSLMAIYSAKESVNAAYEAPLSQGLLLERRLFHALFSTADRREGMAAFTEKRQAEFKDE